jgi:hypothetical protein
VRTTRDKTKNSENEKVYRKAILDDNGKRKQITKGNRSIRTKRYNFSKGSKIKITTDWNGKNISVKKNQTFISGGTASLGAKVYIGKETIPSKICEEITNRKGIIEKIV